MVLIYRPLFKSQKKEKERSYLTVKLPSFYSVNMIHSEPCFDHGREKKENFVSDEKDASVNMIRSEPSLNHGRGKKRSLYHVKMIYAEPCLNRGKGEKRRILYLTEKMPRLDSLTPTGRGDLLASSTFCTETQSNTHGFVANHKNTRFCSKTQ